MAIVNSGARPPIRASYRIPSGLALALAGLAGIVPLLGISGCTGMVNAQPKTGQSAVKVTPATVDFGLTSVGKRISHLASVTNTGTETVMLTGATVSNKDFSISGVQFPLSIQSGQKANFTVWFTGSKAGKSTATFNFHDAKGPTDPVLVTGTAGSTDPNLSVSALSHDFGSVTVNTAATAALTLTNSGASTLKISGVAVTGATFSAGALKPPAKIAAGESVLLNVTFLPKAAGTFAGSVNISSNDPDNPTTNVALSGVATTEAIGKLSATPTILSLGTVKVGASTSAVANVKNVGTGNVTLSTINLNGAGFSASGISTPVVMVPGDSLPLTLKFSPTAAGTKTGTVVLTSSQGEVTSVTVSGTATSVSPAPTPALTISPGSINFGNVVAGVANTQTVQLSNPGSVDVTISAANVTGAGFSASGLNLPLTLNAGQSSTFNVQFNPKTAGAAAGNLSLASNATNSTSSISLSGTGVAAGLTLSVSPTSISFGNVTVGNNSSRSITVTNTGNSNVSISAVNLTGSNLTLSGGSPMTLSPSQSVALTVQFSPTGAGATTGTVSIISDATGSPAAVPVSGTGVAQVQHVVGLSWNASPSAAGYNVYRSAVSGSGYSRLNSGLDSQLSYSDNTVQSSQAYFYVTTAVASDGTESAFSTEVSVNIP